MIQLDYFPSFFIFGGAGAGGGGGGSGIAPYFSMKAFFSFSLARLYLSVLLFLNRRITSSPFRLISLMEGLFLKKSRLCPSVVMAGGGADFRISTLGGSGGGGGALNVLVCACANIVTQTRQAGSNSLFFILLIFVEMRGAIFSIRVKGSLTEFFLSHKDSKGTKKHKVYFVHLSTFGPLWFKTTIRKCCDFILFCITIYVVRL